MKELIDILLTFNELNKQQIELIKQKVKIEKVSKTDYFSQAGNTLNRIAIVKKGILRVCYYNKNGEEVTRYFIDEGNLGTDINSYNNRIPSSEYVQAIIDTELYIFTRQAMDELSNTIVVWPILINQLINKALIEKVNRISPMLAEDAKTRYIEFHDRFPSLVNRIPLNYLASYIGVTKHSLSRIRKEIAKK